LIINSDLQYGRWGRIQEFMRSREFKELMNRKYVPEYELTNMKLEGFESGDVYKIIDNVFCVYDDEGDNFRTVSQQLDCLRLVCDISFLLEEMNSSYFLSDICEYNFGFNYGKPIFIDVGSFSTVGKFVVTESIQKMLDVCGNDSNHHFGLTFKNNWYNLKKDLSKVIINLEKGEWGEYSNLSHLEYESKIAFDWLESKKDIKTIIDIGCGNGEFSKLFCRKGYNVIAIDSNEYCVDSLYRSSSDMKIFCMKMDITKDYTGELGKQWKDKISGDVVFCSSITHHLYHSINNMTFEKQAELWNKISSKYLIIEYIDKKDECLVNWTFGEDYTKDNFLKSLDKNWEVLDTKPSEYPDRCWYFFKKREHI
jgi:SAM-dependent methyltransferase